MKGESKKCANSDSKFNKITPHRSTKKIEEFFGGTKTISSNKLSETIVENLTTTVINSALQGKYIAFIYFR